MGEKNKKITDSNVIIFSALGWVVIFIIVIAAVKLHNNSKPHSPQFKAETVSGFTPDLNTTISQAVENTDTSKIADKLYYEWLNGATVMFNYDDPDGFFGTRLSFKYPESMISAPGDKKRTIRKFAVLDEDRSEFRCVINFQPMKIRSGSLEEKKAALSKDAERRNLEQLRPLLNKFEIIDVAEGLFVATEPASYGEYYFENLKTDAADRICSICRSYTFFYSGGVGSVQFFLDSKKMTKNELNVKFQSYKNIINRMVNSLELSE